MDRYLWETDVLINGLTNELPDIEMGRLRNKSMEYNITPISGQTYFPMESDK